MKPALTLIAAIGRNLAIGRNNRLLWKLPEDMLRFKALTLGHAVVMGRKTWDSLPAKFRPLRDRHNIVLSRDPYSQLSDATVAHTLGDAISAAGDKMIFVIGGEEVYRNALPEANRLELTEVEDAPDADAFFPVVDRNRWKETARDSRPATSTSPAYAFVTYERATQST